MIPSNCPSCGHHVLRDRGPIPGASEFAGQMLSTPLPGGHLYACLGCHLQFRHPLIAQEEMDRLYRSAPEGYWPEAAAAREDFRIATAWVHDACKGGRVLDVGCFRGDFLATLGPAYRTAGIEINAAAAQTASGQGVELVGWQFTDLERHPAAFDVITAFDVIEHVPDPLVFLASIRKALRPQGIAIISTGNTSSFSWKLMGSGYYYCTTPEHIAFINPTWVEIAARRTSMIAERFQEFAHAQAPLSTWAFQALRNLGYRCAPSAACWLHRRFSRRGSDQTSPASNRPPSWISATDHFICQLRVHPG